MYFDHEAIPEPTVADLIAFKDLPEETQRLAERVTQEHACRSYGHIPHNPTSIHDYDYID